MSEHLAYVGLGSNLGDRSNNLENAVAALDEIGSVVRRSAIYESAPWGVTDQPHFLNAVVALRTSLKPHALFDGLLEIERRLGRVPGPRWGPRTIDVDLLWYDGATIADARLRVPHERLAERAFVLVPLAEVDDRFSELRDALPAAEREGVRPYPADAAARVAAGGCESGSVMQPQEPFSASERVRALATFLSENDLVRLRVERGDEAIELTRRRSSPASTRARQATAAPAQRTDTVKADIVGIFHLSRPAPAAGDTVDGDRELGYIEALGIRTPVYSVSPGRVIEVCATDDSPVEYGQALFTIARS